MCKFTVYPAFLCSSQQQTFLCAFQQLQSDSLTSALYEWQLLNVSAEQKPAGSWTGNKCSQRQWCSPQETAALLSVKLRPQTLDGVSSLSGMILFMASDWLNNNDKWIKFIETYANSVICEPSSCFIWIKAYISSHSPHPYCLVSSLFLCVCVPLWTSSTKSNQPTKQQHKVESRIRSVRPVVDEVYSKSRCFSKYQIQNRENAKRNQSLCHTENFF